MAKKPGFESLAFVSIFTGIVLMISALASADDFCNQLSQEDRQADPCCLEGQNGLYRCVSIHLPRTSSTLVLKPRPGGDLLSEKANDPSTELASSKDYLSKLSIQAEIEDVRLIWKKKSGNASHPDLSQLRTSAAGAITLGAIIRLVEMNAGDEVATFSSPGNYKSLVMLQNLAYQPSNRTADSLGPYRINDVLQPPASDVSHRLAILEVTRNQGWTGRLRLEIKPGYDHPIFEAVGTVIPDPDHPGEYLRYNGGRYQTNITLRFAELTKQNIPFFLVEEADRRGPF